MWAAGRGNLDVVKELISKKANIDKANNDGETALILAAMCGHVDVVKELISKKANIDKANNDGITPLMWAAVGGHLDVVKELITNKAGVNIPDHNGWTALMLAAKGSYLNIVKELIVNKANIDQANNDGWTALIEAANGGYLDIVKELIANNVDIDQANDYGGTALIMAAVNGHLEVVKEFIANNVNIDQANNYGDTALIMAAWSGHLGIVKELLNSGSDLLLVNTEGNAETLVLSKLLSNAMAKSSFDKLPQGNFEGLNSLAKLQLFRAFNFMENNYDKFKDFYPIEHIKGVKASVEAFDPLETLINELTDTNLLDFSTADSRHKLEGSIDHLKRLLENKAKYKLEGIVVNQAKIKEFQNKCKVAAVKQYHELIQNLGNIGLKDIFKEYFKLEDIELPDSICAQVYLKLLISNRDAQENISDNEDKVTGKLPCATDMQYETYLLTSNIQELGSILHAFE